MCSVALANDPAAARTSGPNDHALVCLLGMLGLRVSEACATDITDLRYEAGYELLHVLGKGAKPADISLPVPVLRAVVPACSQCAHLVGDRCDITDSAPQFLSRSLPPPPI